MFYVNMVDNFMSGWGGAKVGKSRFSVRCTTLEQATQVPEAYASHEDVRDA
jgi:hypothetical protein